MTGKEVIVMLMKKHNVSNVELAKWLGLSRATVWARLDPRKSDNMTEENLREMLEALGYELVVVPDGYSAKHKHTIRISGGEDE